MTTEQASRLSLVVLLAMMLAVTLGLYMGLTIGTKDCHVMNDEIIDAKVVLADE